MICLKKLLLLLCFRSTLANFTSIGCYNNIEYFLVTSKDISQEGAKAECEIVGGTLPLPNNEGEIEELLNFAWYIGTLRDFWLGFDDKDTLNSQALENYGYEVKGNVSPFTNNKQLITKTIYSVEHMAFRNTTVVSANVNVICEKHCSSKSTDTPTSSPTNYPTVSPTDKSTGSAAAFSFIVGTLGILSLLGLLIIYVSEHRKKEKKMVPPQDDSKNTLIPGTNESVTTINPMLSTNAMLDSSNPSLQPRLGRPGASDSDIALLDAIVAAHTPKLYKKASTDYESLV